MNTILLATDGSPSAKLATDEAIRLASATGWPLRVVTVWNTPIPVGYNFAALQLPPELRQLERAHAREAAQAAVTRAAVADVDATFELREGMAADEIVAAAAESHASLLVLGAHGWGAVKRLVLGSVSTQVLHESPCPVLVVREHKPADHRRTRPGARATA